jgi:nucleoside transporter
MMFLQYAIWGAWLPILLQFLRDHREMEPAQIGNIFAFGAVGAIVAPFIAGQIADRWFSTEKFLAFSHLAGGILVWQLASIDSYAGFMGFSLAYSLLYSPTMPLTNSLAFHHLPDRDRDFGQVRVWGTVGWIAAGIAIGQWLLYRHTPVGVNEASVLAAQSAGMADAFKLSGGLGVLMGLFCLTLPHTPPSQGETASATGEALGEIKKQPLVTLFLLAVPISCIHQFYFFHTAKFLGGIQAQAGDFVETVNKVFGVGGIGLMTIGQMSEIVVLSLIPLFVKRVNRKTLLALGLVAYATRMALFAYADEVGLGGVLTGVALHGPCFGLFIFLAFMIVDEETSENAKASAQSLFNLVIVGIGVIVGSKIAAAVENWVTVDGEISYRALFSYPMWASLVCLGWLLLAYPGGPGREKINS